MQAAGFLMLAAVAAVMLSTGVPVFAAMIGVVSVFAAGGVAAGAFPYALLTALPSRVIGLLETDLLQALPLFVLMGGLLNRLPLAGIVFRVLTRWMGRSGAAPVMAGFVLGLLMAPMNGSVGASVAMLTRVLSPRLRAADVPPADGMAAVCAASTLGVVVPPSLVLILFGDAMMRAHTEAVNATGAMVRILNTQDVFRGALLPAGLLFGLYLLLAWWRGRGAPAPERPTVSWRDQLVASVTLLSIAGLLGAVVAGYLYAVEAAAAGAVALLLIGTGTGALRGGTLRDLLADTMAVTGALFALFLAATSFTLVFRAFGSDRLLAAFITGLPAAALIVLLMIGVCALVLDAFEIILVIVPLLLPPVLMVVPDAVWMGVLVLLVLQASFLIPPFGYAIMMARGMAPERPSLRSLTVALAPYLLTQLVVLGLIAAMPRLTHWGAVDDGAIKPVMTDEEARKKMLSMPEPDD